MIADLAAQTAQLTQNTRLQSEQMEALSAQLLQRVQFFQLPDVALKQGTDPSNTQLLLAANTLTVESAAVS